MWGKIKLEQTLVKSTGTHTGITLITGLGGIYATNKGADEG